MANTRKRTAANREEGNHNSETAQADSRQEVQIENPPDPPIPQMLRGIVDDMPQVEVETEEPVLQPVDPQAALMTNLMQMMNTAMDRREERFMKMLEDRDASRRRNETVAENALNGSGAVVHGTGTEEQVVVGEEGPERGCSYKTFLFCKPPEFHGRDDPIACMNWIREIEQAFRACDCGESQKVKYGSQMLRGTALTWWNILTSTLPAAVVAKMTWDSFKTKVLEEYCNEQEMDRIEGELRTLQKGDLSVREYTRLFMEKLNLVGHVAPTEKEKIKAYLKGLPVDMMAMVRNSKATTLRETIEEAKLMETVYAKEKEGKNLAGEKRKWEGSSGSVRQFKQFSGGRQMDNRREARWCHKCRSKHFGPCKTRSFSGPMECYKCGKKDHLSRDCPLWGPICFECREPGHIKRDCPKIVGGNRGMSAGSTARKENLPKAPSRAFQMWLVRQRGTPMWFRVRS